MSKSKEQQPARQAKGASPRSGVVPLPEHQFKPGQSGNPKKELTWKRMAIVDALPSHGWDITKAALSVGFAESYAKTRLPVLLKNDVLFCQAVEAKRQEIELKEVPRREKRLQDLDRLIEDPDTADRDVIAAVQVQGRMCGWLSETIRHETTDRQQLLDEAARQEAARLALLSLDTRALPDGTMSSRVAHSAGTKSVASKIVPSGVSVR
ncbi:hypothetical protein ACFL6U_31485 [Planctomycetota bacterium]